MFDLGARQLGRQRAADETAAFSNHGEMVSLGSPVAEQRFLGFAGRLHKLAPLGRAEFPAGRQHPLFGFSRNGRIHVVAAQHQMISDGDAPQSRADFDEREVGRSAADIDHQNQPDAFENAVQLVAMPRREIVERGLRLFDERELFEARTPRSIHRQSARDFVERCRHRDDDFLPAERRLRMRGVPAFLMCARSRDDASTGDIFGISGGAPHGRIGADRSTPEWLNQLFAEIIRREGTFAPCQRANSPAIGSGAQPACSPGR